MVVNTELAGTKKIWFMCGGKVLRTLDVLNLPRPGARLHCASSVLVVKDEAPKTSVFGVIEIECEEVKGPK